ncbi:MAG: hypothetical protein JW747_07410 [Candidatus Aminicenantes bacterium]|nr:hypothetical protein [Candidatus Aminicenantes bacterium]
MRLPLAFRPRVKRTRGENDCARAGECIRTRVTGDSLKISAQNQLSASALEEIFLGEAAPRSGSAA